MRRRLCAAVATLLLTLSAGFAVTSATRTPSSVSAPRARPLASHPGNVFLTDESVEIASPQGGKVSWILRDADHQVTAQGESTQATILLGTLPTGYYEVEFLSPETKKAPSPPVSLAVLPPLARPGGFSSHSPIRLDVGMAWLVPADQAEAMASLCQLAGVSWIRDRFRWSEIQPTRSSKSGPTRSDVSSQIAQRAGLRVLQTHHETPSWAGTETTRFPEDLRDVHAFHEEVAQRWKASVQAFEPWNEADIEVFGGHTGMEMATYQKAAYWGLKSGNPSVWVCQNAFATPRRTTLEDFAANQPWGYFDSFNFHHYLEPADYGPTYSRFREVSGGKPIWITECGQSLHWEGNPQERELSSAALRIQAERVAKMFAMALHQGADAVFYFLLPHYAEGQNQFGLLRKDLTPRPAYVALATVGRWLQDARPLGRWTTSSPDITALGFQTGADEEVVVAWTRNQAETLELPIPPLAACDHLGRAVPLPAKSGLFPVGSAPRFIRFQRGTFQKLPHTKPPRAELPQLSSPVSPIVLQAVFPKERTLLSQSAYRIAPDRREPVTLFAYNFSSNSVAGVLKSELPPGWSAELLPECHLEPGERRSIPLILDTRGRVSENGMGTVKIRGDFGAAGSPLLAIRLQPDQTNKVPMLERPLASASNPTRWIPVVSGSGPATILRSNDFVTVEAFPLGDNRWVYPQFILTPEEKLDDRYNAVELKFVLLEGAGDFHLILDEENGSSYMADFDQVPRVGGESTVLIRLDSANWGATWSMPDPNTSLDAGQVKSVRIGCNTSQFRVKYGFKGLRWLRL